MFDGKTVVVIGGGSGIGFRVAERVVAGGGRVLIGGRSADRLAGAVERLGPAAAGRQVDAGSTPSVAAFFDRIPRLDHLFTSAACHTLMPIDAIDNHTDDNPFQVKFWGQYRAVTQALPRLAADGSVVLMGGAAGARPGKGRPAYAACNAAIEGLGRGLAIDLAPIRVNVVAPGMIEGDLWRRQPPELREPALAGWQAASLLGRPGTEDEVADAVVFLMGNRFMTGTTLSPDGGYLLR